MVTAPPPQAQESRPAPTPGPRLGWVDYAKGICILLVVASHVTDGVGKSFPAAAGTEAFRLFRAFAYSFQMPVFFFLTGLFVERSARKGASAFWSDKLRAVLYPYVLWTLLQTGIGDALGGLTNGDHDLAYTVVRLPFRPVAQFWFLYALFFCLALYWGLRWAGINRTGMLALSVPLFGASHWLWGLPWSAPYFVGAHFFYLALGNALSARLRDFPRAARPLPLLAAGAALLGGLLALLCAVPNPPAWSAPLRALAGGAGVVALSLGLEGAGGLAALRRLGERSLPVYLAHVLGAAGARILLGRGLGVTSIGVHVLVGMAAGLAFPLALDALARRRGWNGLFTLKGG